mgnify:FL=1
MSKKPTTFTEKDRKNYEEGKDIIPTESLLGQCLENKAEEDSKKMPEPDNAPSWDTEEHIWSASQARKRADTYGVRSLRNGVREVMRYIKTAANSGQYECTVYNDNISADVTIDSIIKNLTERGYTVKKFEQYGGWYIKISW